MNGRYLRELPLGELHAALEERLGRELPLEAVKIAQEKMQTLDDFWTLAGFLVERQPTDDKAWSKVMRDGAAERLAKARDALERTEPFTPEAIEASLRSVVDETGDKPNKVFQPLRVAISGSTVSPGIFESVAALGREETLARVDDALLRANGRI
jgi:glutamyl-tRNA synthetase